MRAVDLLPLPLPVSVRDYRYTQHGDAVFDDFVAGLAIVYLAGPPYGKRLISYADLDRWGWSRRTLRDRAAGALDERRDDIRIYGHPPALMLSFNGLESSLLLASRIWDDLSEIVAGDIVIGVPARDVVMVTGSRSPSGLERVRRTVDRTFFARHRHPLSGHLLIRRGRSWAPLADQSALSRVA